MKYISTRGHAPILGFCDAMMSGLASDSGLYLPQSYPKLSASDIANLANMSYSQMVKTILWPFIDGEIARADFDAMVDEAYASFSHSATCPLVQTNHNEFILELFHGPTLAFKDVAMQLISRLMDYILTKRQARATIIGATSGDTGGAAIEAFANRMQSDIFILFPKGRVSPVQQRQMTTNNAANVFALAVEGDFDDCQALVKAMFNDKNFRQDVGLSGINSINWARIMAQIVYYFYAAVSLGAPNRPISFCVPTGNFGDIFAGYVAKQMGLPIDRLIIATNDNDILVRTLESGVYQTRPLIATTSPSMDIQVSSNFERLLFEASGRDSQTVINAMDSLKQSGQFSVPQDTLAEIKTLFCAGRSNIDETAMMINELYQQSGYLADPHTATAVKVARQYQRADSLSVVLATAHPAKFPDAIYSACAIKAHLPANLEPIMKKAQNFTPIANDEALIKQFIREKTRA